MAQLVDTFDLDTLGLRSGDGRRFDLVTRIEPIDVSGMRYAVAGGRVPLGLDVSRMVSGFALRMRFDATLEGSCMRCMADARPVISVDAREVDQPGEAEELHSPYLEGPLLHLAEWARDALVLATPPKVLCREDCRGLCPVCGVNLNDPGQETHGHDEGTDPRWAKLREARLR